MTAMDVRGSVDLSAHGIESTGTRALEPVDPAAVRARRHPWRGADRRGRPDGRRHRRAHRPLAAGQVHRARAGLGGAHLVGRQQGVLRGAVRPACATRSRDFLARETSLYVIDAFAGADPAHRIAVRVITTHPYHALFAKTMFIDPTDDELQTFTPRGARAPRARARRRPGRGRNAHRHVRRAASRRAPRS